MTPNGDNAMEQARDQVRQRMAHIRHKILVLSGKGGVGKSTVAASLAMALAQRGRRVGLLDVDLHGPSIPKLLNLEGRRLAGTDDAIEPVDLFEGFKVVSMGFALRNADEAVIWRGPRKFGVIQQFLKDVVWGELDDLVVDSPPGTGDEPLAAAQLIGSATGAVIVTTPQDVAVSDVRRCITFCRQIDTPILGVIENMSGFVCPHCNRRVDVFKSGGGADLADAVNVPFLGAIPLDPGVVEAGDSGAYLKNTVRGETFAAFDAAVDRLLAELEHARPGGGDVAHPDDCTSDCKACGADCASRKPPDA